MGDVPDDLATPQHQNLWGCVADTGFGLGVVRHVRWLCPVLLLPFGSEAAYWPPFGPSIHKSEGHDDDSVEPEKYLAMYPEFLLPEKQKGTWFRARIGAVVGRTFAERFGSTNQSLSVASVSSSIDVRRGS